MLLPEKSPSAVAAALDSLEGAVGKDAFQHLFGLVLTDNGAKFSDHDAIERSARAGKAARCKVYYCDVYKSQQKAGCERNHAELRKLLPKRRGLSFDDLGPADLAVAMSQLNSEPRPSLAGMSPAQMPLAAHEGDGRALMDALGCELLPYGELDLGGSAAALGRRGGSARCCSPADTARPTRAPRFPKPIRMSPRAAPRGPAEPCPRTRPDAPNAVRRSRLGAGRQRTAPSGGRPLTAKTTGTSHLYG